jgi:hypothetical protein
MKKLTSWFNITNDEKNPLMVNATISFAWDHDADPAGWYWEVDQIHGAELIICDKEGIDITRQLLNNDRAIKLVTEQVAECEDQIIEAIRSQQNKAA